MMIYIWKAFFIVELGNKNLEGQLWQFCLKWEQTLKEDIALAINKFSTTTNNNS